MFTTSLTAAVVSGLFVSGSLVGLSDWSESYGKAIALAGEKHKPVAVFLAAGDLGQLTNGKGLGTDALKSIRNNYIAVRIDTTSEEGQQLAGAFGLTQGVVLSDRTGKAMVLKHGGTITPEQLAVYLTKHAATEVAVTTEYHGAAPVFLSAPQPQFQTVQPQFQTVPYSQPTYQPVQYQQPRPVLNAIQTVGGAIQNVGGVVFSPFVGGS
ncbi:MAG: hypothetical protein MUF18_11465 [Fimbriiglobus sp.]|jgi:hypothetical protein|nr:hypothetical protein [Fimbriiglobus sp.]